MASGNSLNSTRTDLDTLCDLCGKYYKGSKGLKIHNSRSHNNQNQSLSVSSQPSETSTPTPSTSAQSQNLQIVDVSMVTACSSSSTPKPEIRNKCQHCDQCFNTPRGVKLHVSKSHGEVQRLNISGRYGNQDRVEQNSDSVDLNNSSQSHTQKAEKIEILNKNLEMYTNELLDLMNSASCDVIKFDNVVSRISSEFKNAIDILPGPKHPATKFYRARKVKQTFTTNNRTFKNSTNPERHSKRDRCKRKEKYNHDLMQFQYYNRRKKCVQKIMNSGKPEQCQINSETLFAAFNERWGEANDCVRENYDRGPNENEQHELDSEFS
jgi:hypothetical protein